MSLSNSTNTRGFSQIPTDARFFSAGLGASGGTGVYGSDGNGGYGVFGTSTVSSTGIGVYGSGYLYGVEGQGTGTLSSGVVGGGYLYGVYASASHGTGVYGESDSGSYGVHGVSTTSPGTGVFGEGYNFGVYATASSGTGVYGSGTAKGVWGSSGTIGVYGVGSSSLATGVYGDCTTTGCLAGYFHGNVTISGSLTVGSNPCCASDVRLKRNVEPISGAIDKLLRLKGVSFEWTDPAEHDNDATTQTGFIAQEVEKVFPAWVKQDGYTAPDGQKYKTLELRQIEALEVESIRTLKVENDDLKARVKALEDARRPVVTMNANGIGFGIGGLAVAAAIIVSRRKRSDDPEKGQHD